MERSKRGSKRHRNKWTSLKDPVQEQDVCTDGDIAAQSVCWQLGYQKRKPMATHIAGNVTVSNLTEIGHDDAVVDRLQMKTNDVLFGIIVTF